MPIETSARIAFLKKIHLFHDLEDDELQAVAEELVESSYPTGSLIFEQDGKAESFYLIYGGSVRIVRKKDGKEIQLALLVKEDYFGEMALVANRPRSGTVTALTDTSLLVLSRKDFEKLYKRAPQLRLNLSVAIKSRELARSLRFSWLRPDEVIYFLARKHAIMLYEKLILPALALTVPIGLFYGWWAILDFKIVLLAATISLVVVILWIAWEVIDWGNDYYIVTNQRAVWLEKVIGIYDSRQESPLSAIVSVDVETGPLGRILDYGTVVMRTYVGKILFKNVIHPEQAALMIEEYENRTKKRAVEMEKQTMKDVLRKKLGVPDPAKPQPAPAAPTSAESPNSSPPNGGRAAFLKLLGANTLKLRYEVGDNVIYRKHGVVLVLDAWLPLSGVLASLGLFLYRLFRLALLPNEAFISLQGGLRIDGWAGALFVALLVFGVWFAYRVMDWSNDRFEVTPEQIIDIDRKPFGTESRNVAQLDNILSTRYERKGLLGNLFNFGHVTITVGGNKLVFEDVMDPGAVQSDIDRRRNARITKKKDAEVSAERERMAEWLATYHHNAEEFRKAEEKKNQKPE